MTAQPITLTPDYALGAPTVRLLGPMEYLNQRLPSASKKRQTLALLASRAGKPVTMATLIEELWGDSHRIAKPAGSVETYILMLRKVLSRAAILTCPGGYLLNVDPLAVDAARFVLYVDQAEREHHLLTAQDILRAAMSLWRGPALVDVPIGPVLARWVAGIEDKLRTARGLGWDIALQLGQHRTILDELRATMREDWTAELVAQQLMLALYRSGRRVEALNVYRIAREALADEQGLDPCPELERLQQQILSGDPALELKGEH